jgi:hypothetical protein
MYPSTYTLIERSFSFSSSFSYYNISHVIGSMGKLGPLARCRWRVVVTKEKDILGGSIYPVSGGELFCFVYNKKG